MERLLTLILLSGCLVTPGEITTHGLDRKKLREKSSKSFVKSVEVKNNRFIISGDFLDNVNRVKITGYGVDEEIKIENQNSKKLEGILSTKAITITMGRIFSLLISDAYGQSVYPVSFTLQNGAIEARHISPMGAVSGQVLKFDGTKWAPDNLGALTYIGTWNASTNNPDLTQSHSAGDFYIVGTSGTQDLGGGSTSFAVGDWAVWNDNLGYFEKVANASSVSSFNGRTGAIIPLWSDLATSSGKVTGSSINHLADVDTTGIASGKILKYDGTNWVIADDDTGSVSANAVGSGEIQDGSIASSDLASNAVTNANISNGSISLDKLDTSGAISSLKSNSRDGFTLNSFGSSAGETGELRFSDLDDSNYIGFKAPDTLSSDLVYTLPNGDGSSGQVLTTDGSGVLSWSTVSGGGTPNDNSVTSAKINNGAIVNDDINASAAIALSKISGLSVSDTLNIGGLTTVLQPGLVVQPYGTSAGNTGELRFNDLVAGGSFHIALKAPDTLGSNFTLTLPVDDGTTGQVLTTDGSGVLSFSDVASKVLSGFSVGADSTVTNTDSIEVAIEKLQGQINGNNSDISGKQNALTTGTSTQFFKGDLSLGTFSSEVSGVTLSGFATGADSTVTSSDSIEVAIEKLQGQINANNSEITGSAGGDLTGNYPNPTIAAGAIDNAKISGVDASKISGIHSSLHLSKTGEDISLIVDSDDSHKASLMLRKGVGESYYLFSSDSDYNFRLYNSEINRTSLMIVSDTNQVGINVHGRDPNAKFEVVGDILLGDSNMPGTTSLQTCTYPGTMRYNAALKMMQYCSFHYNNGGSDVNAWLPTPWITATYYSGNWSTYTQTGLVYDAAQYMKDASGVVHLRGVITPSSCDSSVVTAIQLPVGFRPKSSHLFLIDNHIGYGNAKLIGTDQSSTNAGKLNLDRDCTTYWNSLAGINFSVH